MPTRPDTQPSLPQTLADHAKAYAELILEELNESRNLWRKRTQLQVLGVCGLGVGGTLAGMATMLWAVTPPTQIHALWALVATPLVFLAMGAVCLMAAKQQIQPAVFEQTRERFMADMALLKKTNLATKATELIVLPMATAHPYRLVLGAALVGALAVRAHPWRWLSGSAVLVGLLPKVISVLSSQNKIQS
jgi:uncharacterized membrane protein YqjE